MMLKADLLPLIHQLKAECLRAASQVERNDRQSSLSDSDSLSNSTFTVAGPVADNADSSVDLSNCRRSRRRRRRCPTEPRLNRSARLRLVKSAASAEDSAATAQANASNSAGGVRSGRRRQHEKSMSPMATDSKLSEQASVYQYLIDSQSKAGRVGSRGRSASQKSRQSSGLYRASTRRLERQYDKDCTGIDSPFNKSVADRIFGRKSSESRDTRDVNSETQLDTLTDDNGDSVASSSGGSSSSRQRLIGRVKQLDSWLVKVKRRLKAEERASEGEKGEERGEENEEDEEEEVEEKKKVKENTKRGNTNNALKTKVSATGADCKEVNQFGADAATLLRPLRASSRRPSRRSSSVKSESRQPPRRASRGSTKESTITDNETSASPRTTNSRAETWNFVSESQTDTRIHNCPTFSNSSAIESVDKDAQINSRISTSASWYGTTLSTSFNCSDIVDSDTSPKGKLKRVGERVRDAVIDFGTSSSNNVGSVASGIAELETKGSHIISNSSSSKLPAHTPSYTSNEFDVERNQDDEERNQDAEERNQDAKKRNQDAKKRNQDAKKRNQDAKKRNQDAMKRIHDAAKEAEMELFRMEGNENDAQAYILKTQKQLRMTLRENLNRLKHHRLNPKPNQLRKAVEAHMRDIHKLSLKFDQANARFIPLLLHLKKWAWNSKEFAEFTTATVDQTKRYHARNLHKWTKCIRVEASRQVPLQAAIDAVNHRIGLVNYEVMWHKIAFPDDAEFGRDSQPLEPSKTPHKLRLRNWENVYLVVSGTKPNKPPILLQESHAVAVVKEEEEEELSELIDNSNHLGASVFSPRSESTRIDDLSLSIQRQMGQRVQMDTRFLQPEQKLGEEERGQEIVEEQAEKVLEKAEEQQELESDYQESSQKVDRNEEIESHTLSQQDKEEDEEEEEEEEEETLPNNANSSSYASTNAFDLPVAKRRYTTIGLLRQQLVGQRRQRQQKLQEDANDCVSGGQTLTAAFVGNSTPPSERLAMPSSSFNT